jgi:hypothetical protein
MNNARITTERRKSGWLGQCLPQARTEAATTNNRLSGATAKAFRQQRVVLELGR